MASSAVRSAADDLLRFINSSPSPFHAVESTRTRLVAAGFAELKERESWDVKPNGKYFFTRNRSTIVAFAVGGLFKPGNGFAVIGAHTDSPCLKVKPKSKIEKEGFLQLGVELYGGGIWHSWFDRDLSLAGRAMVHKSDGTVAHHLIRFDKPLLRIPTLAIHLDRSVNSDGFKFNLENELKPILGLQRSLDNKVDDKGKSIRHHPILVNLLSSQLGCEPGDIMDFELCLYDTQPGIVGGVNNEFLFAPRLDNLFNAYAATEALINSTQHEDNGLEYDSVTRMIALFDNEEVGSESAYGAASLLLESTMRRLSAGGSPLAFEEAMAKSFLVSADQAHGVHPNYPSKHEDNNRPALGGGVVIKQNANQRYATTAVTSTLMRMIAQRIGLTLQDFAVKNDMPCGSTIGPILSSGLGLRTIDMGSAQLSMHSIRETGAVDDVKTAVDLYTAFFKFFSSSDAKLSVD